jgi:hypothetical protein
VGTLPGLVSRRRLLASLLALAALALAAPATAGAVIVPQQGMADVRLGMTYAQLRAELGAPTRAYYVRDPVLGRYLLMRYGALKISLPSPTGRVAGVATIGRVERTATGVGVGSPRSVVRARVPGARCGIRVCLIGTIRRGRTFTLFRLSPRGFVTEVAIARFPAP